MAQSPTPTLLASAARTASVNTADQKNRRWRGVKVTVDVTVDPASASLTFVIQGKDPTSGKYYAILTSAAIAAVGTTVLTVYPGATPATNLTVSDVLPHEWRVAVTAADSDSMTYSVGATLLP